MTTQKLTDYAQEQIDHVLQCDALRDQEFAVWCVNKVWTHRHWPRQGAWRTFEDAQVAARSMKCHYDSEGVAEFVVLARDVHYSGWRQP